MNLGTVAILGPGLIGGSLALALAERGLTKRLMIYARSPRALDLIRTAGVDAELTGNPSEAVRDADVVVLCVPIEAMAGLVREFRDALKPNALVTDVGSVKGSVDRDLAPLLDDRALWIGSHPMAGSEQAGFAAARADLFEGAAVIVTPTRHTQQAAEQRAGDFWRALGARVINLSPEIHDLHVAQISHLPHLLAAALVNQACAEARELAGGGFRDTTRVASGSPELWTEILLANGQAVARQLDRLMGDLRAIEGVLKSGDKAAAKSTLFLMLQRAQDARSQMTESNPLFKKTLMSRSPASTLAVRPVRHIGGELTVPGDKSLSHRSVLFSALADGTTVITGFLPGEDCVCTMRALQAMGASIEVETKTSLIVHGTSGKLQPPLEPLDCGNSGTAMRLLAGVLAGQPFKSRLIGDASLSGRPMKRIVDPLRKMGATIRGRGETHTAPLEIEGGPLTGIDYTLPVASAQLKSCILLAGLFATGTTSVTEKTPTRDHTERLLAHFHAPPVIDLKGEGTAKIIRVRGGSRLHARDFSVPGDFSSAAFWIAAAAAFPGSDLTITNLGLNGTRTGLLSVLLRMGAHLQETISDSSCEPFGIVRVYGRKLRGTRIAGAEIANVIDELPVIAVTAALAEGPTEIRDARELRVKETDRIAAMAKNLRAFGVTVDEHDDGMTIHGGAALKAAKVGSFGDHRIAMACAVLGLFAKGETVIEDAACIATSYPTFREDLVKIAYFHDTGFASLLSARR